MLNMSKTVMSVVFVVIVLIAGVITNVDFRNKVNSVVPTKVAETVTQVAPVASASGRLATIQETGVV